MRREKRQTASFAVQDDAGRMDMAYEFTEFMLDQSHSGSEWIEGLKEFKLSNGDRLNRIDADTYEWVRQRKTLRRV